MKKRTLSWLLLLAMTVSLFAGLTLTAQAGSVAAVDPTGYTCADDVDYVKVSGKYICNWGARGEDCVFLSSYAADYYTGNYTFDKLSAYAGSDKKENVPSSALYSALKNMMVAKKTSETSYAGTKGLYQYTDCLKSDYAHISSFYSGTELNGEWDGGSSWNREHTWPNSKISGNGENDISMLRPTAVSENSDRGNKAYGETTPTFYNPNAESNGKYDLRGDCARIVLFVYTRWGVTDTMWGASGVMESLDILLKWMKEDPVDTWEMGRNDACQSIVGVRNVFVDYPEFAWLLFNKDVPANYTTPSTGGTPALEGKVTAVSNNTDWGTVSVNGNVITCVPADGYYLADAQITEGTGSLKTVGYTVTVNAGTDVTVLVTFAKVEEFTMRFVVPEGVTANAITANAGIQTVLPAPSGTPADKTHDYEFAGWLDTPLEETATEPSALMKAGTLFAMKQDTTLYAVYKYTEKTGDAGSGDYVRVDEAPSDWCGTYVIVYEPLNYLFDSSLETLDASSNYHKVDVIENKTVKAADGDPYQIVIDKTAGGYSIKCANGKYMGMSASDNKIQQGDTPYANTISLTELGGADIVSATTHLRYNKQSGQTRFRYYKSSSYTNQQEISLYRKDTNSTVTYYLSLTAAAPCTHANTEVRDAKDAACTEDGYTGDTYCTDCGEKLEEGTTIPALGHTEAIDEAVAATCTDTGLTEGVHCTVCEEILVAQEEVPAFGHDYADGICTRCGGEDPDYIPPAPVDPCDGYTDIDRTAWYHTFADFVIENGLMGSTSTSKLTFEPTASCTRAMIVTILYSLAGKPEVTFEAKFSDVAEGQWFAAPVIWAAQNGVVSGYTGGTFGPNDKITREQMAVIFKGYAENILGADTSKTEDLSGFDDANKVTWSASYLSWAVAEGLIAGKASGKQLLLDPQGNATRAEVAVILKNFLTD